MVPRLLIFHWERLDKWDVLLKRVLEGHFVSRMYVWFDKDAANFHKLLRHQNITSLNRTSRLFISSQFGCSR